MREGGTEVGGGRRNYDVIISGELIGFKSEHVLHSFSEER